MKNAKSYKSAVYSGASATSDFWDGRAIDKQINLAKWNAGAQFGDEANEQFLQAIEGVIRTHGMADGRPIFQHAQFLRPDQLPRIKAVGGTTSFTAGGLYPMGDYLTSLVPDRLAWVGAARRAPGIRASSRDRVSASALAWRACRSHRSPSR